MDLANAQWARIEPFFPVKPRRADCKGRPPTPPRPILNAILWILRAGAHWADLPPRYPSRPRPSPLAHNHVVRGDRLRNCHILYLE
ncbi:MAG: transposase [Planctomycetes bacterium]|nr:transposase [Planctomycetota bacterium]